MKNTIWINEVLLDMAAFAEENDLPKTYDALIKAMAITTIETQRVGSFAQRNTGNVIPLLKRSSIKFAQP